MLAESYKYLPEQIISSGISLESIGVNEVAWEYEMALSVVDFLKDNRMPILGGDVYKRIAGEVVPTYDNWFVNRSECGYLMQRTFEKAKTYILDYAKNHGEGYLYSIIFEV